MAEMERKMDAEKLEKAGEMYRGCSPQRLRDVIIPFLRGKIGWGETSQMSPMEKKIAEDTQPYLDLAQAILDEKMEKGDFDGNDRRW